MRECLRERIESDKVREMDNERQRGERERERERAGVGGFQLL